MLFCTCLVHNWYIELPLHCLSLHFYFGCKDNKINRNRKTNAYEKQTKNNL